MVEDGRVVMIDRKCGISKIMKHVRSTGEH